MKRFLKIFFISFACVVVAVGLAVGGLFLFNGLDEKAVYANDLKFSITEYVTSAPFSLKVTTETEDVTKTEVKLSCSLGGREIVDFPEYVKINEPFYVIPKKDNDGNNIGGLVTLRVEYDGDDANLNVSSNQCKILVDVPINETNVNLGVVSTSPGQTISFCKKGSELNSKITITPNNALMPYATQNISSSSLVTDKALYLELTDGSNNYLDNNTAYFSVNGDKQNSNIIQVNYASENGKIVFKDKIDIVMAEKEGGNSSNVEIKVNCYVYSSYKEQLANISTEGVTLNKNVAKTNSGNFVVGDYEINGISVAVADTTQEVYLDLDKTKPIKIYLNNPNAAGKDINLGMMLDTTATNLSDLYLLNTSIKIEDNAYWNILKSNNDIFEDTSDLWIPIQYDENKSLPSLSKEQWYWIFDLDNFDAYYNYYTASSSEKENHLLTVFIRYFEKREKKEIEYIKSFKIKPIVKEVESITVAYKDGENSIKVESGKEELTLQKATYTNNILTNPGFKITPSDATFQDLGYYLTYDNNTIQTVPNKDGNYKVKFSYTLGEGESCNNIDVETKNSWGTISEKKIYCGGVEKTNNYTAGDKLDFEVYISIDADSIIPSDTLFLLKEESTTIAEIRKVKFYEKDSSDFDVYSDIPCLIVNNIKLYTDFEYCVEDGNEYLKINNNNFKVEGVGNLIVRAQSIYTNTDKIYWINNNNFAEVKVDVYQNLSDITVYKYTSDTSYNDAVGLNYDEKDKNYYYLFITSTTLERLTEYINANKVTLLSEQIFSDDLEVNKQIIKDYPNIKNINKDTITFGNWEEVVDSSTKLVGYRISYSVGEVHTIKINIEEYDPKFKISLNIGISGVNPTIKYNTSLGMVEELSFDVKDIVFNSATLQLTNGTTPYTGNQDIVLYAGVDNSTGNVVYKFNQAYQNEPDFSNVFSGDSEFSSDYLVYYFSDTATTPNKSIENMSGSLDCQTSGIASQGLGSFVVTNETTGSGATPTIIDSGKGGLTFKNVPRVNGGVKFELTVRPNQVDNSNAYYTWDTQNNCFVQKNYEDLTKTLNFVLYGLDITVGLQDTIPPIDAIENQSYYIDSIFNITINSKNSDETKGSSITGLTSYSTDLFVIQNTNDLVTIANDQKTFSINNYSLENKNATFSFYIGTSTNKIKIGGNSSYSLLIETPFSVSLNQNSFNSPCNSCDLITAKNGDDDITSSEAISLSSTSNKIKVEVKSVAIQDSYKLDLNNYFTESEISSLITTSGDFKISIKACPISFKANVLVKMTLLDASSGTDTTIDYKDLSFEIIVNPKFDEKDLTFGGDETVGDQNINYINAGVDYKAKNYANDDTKITFSENIAGTGSDYLKNISDINVSFADLDDNPYVEASKHMYAKWDFSSKNLTIKSYDINKDKNVRIIFLIVFADGGKAKIVKDVLVKANLSLTFNYNSMTESVTYVQLNNNTTYAIMRNGENVSFNGDGVECETITQVDDAISGTKTVNFNEYKITFSNSVFEVSNIGNSYKIIAKSGASAICGGQTTISFAYYVEVSDSSGYYLNFDFNIEIVAPSAV